MDITGLRSKVNIDFTRNIFSKDELKFLFMANYMSKQGQQKTSALHNNQTYQCFRVKKVY